MDSFVTLLSSTKSVSVRTQWGFRNWMIATGILGVLNQARNVYVSRPGHYTEKETTTVGGLGLETACRFYKASTALTAIEVAGGRATEIERPPHPFENCRPLKCLPCLPVPVGGLAYDHHSAKKGNDPHDGMPNHTHHLLMAQSPPEAGCRCFWRRDRPVKPTNGFSPLPGAVPVEPASGGGIAP